MARPMSAGALVPRQAAQETLAVIVAPAARVTARTGIPVADASASATDDGTQAGAHAAPRDPPPGTAKRGAWSAVRRQRAVAVKLHV
jgi:hypothetical protein